MNNETKDLILKFRDDRNWKQFHNPKDLAISINLQASELLENFQWSGQDLTVSDKAEKIKEELADVMIYCILMSDVIGVNIDEIIKEKITLNEQKYSVKDSYGSNKKYTEFGDVNDTL